MAGSRYGPAPRRPVPPPAPASGYASHGEPRSHALALRAGLHDSAAPRWRRRASALTDARADRAAPASSVWSSGGADRGVETIVPTFTAQAGKLAGEVRRV